MILLRMSRVMLISSPVNQSDKQTNKQTDVASSWQIIGCTAGFLIDIT